MPLVGDKPQGSGCDVCGSPSCTSYPVTDLSPRYPFLRGGDDAMVAEPITQDPESESDPEVDDALRKGRRSRKGPVRNRARRLAEDRARRLEGDR